METKEKGVRHEGLLDNHKQEILVETCRRTFGERESFRIYILAPVGLVMQVSMFGRRGWGGGADKSQGADFELCAQIADPWDWKLVFWG